MIPTASAGVVVAGIGSSGDFTGIPIGLFMFTMMEKRIQGALFGGCNPKADIPRQIHMYEQGQLELDQLITRTYSLDEVAQGYEDPHAGVNIRGLITFEGSAKYRRPVLGAMYAGP